MVASEECLAILLQKSMVITKDRLRQIFFLFGDIFSLVFGFLLVFALRRRTPFFPPLQEFSFYSSFLWVYVFSFVGLFFAFRFYEKERPQFSLSYLADYVRALLCWGFIMIGFAFLAQANYSRVLLLYALIPGFIFPFLIRLIVVRVFPQTKVFSEEEEIAKRARELIEFHQISTRELDVLEGLKEERTDSYFYLFAKRSLDIALSVFGLLFCIPFIPFVALWIKRDSRGPILITQERVGRGGEIFLLYKLRTMIFDTPLYAAAPRERSDERITSAGRFLRSYSLDELPQLWNVLKGEMSLVGPRPEMPFLVARHNDWQKRRLLVKPGITGLWQVLGRKDLPLSENLEYDFYYINHRSFLLDVVILLRTVPAIVLKRGAY